MRALVLLGLISVAAIALACMPAASPVSISTKPSSINNIPQTNVPLPPSKPLAEMSWALLDGGDENLGMHRGKAVILDFWATFCGPCREEIPHLNALKAKYGDDLMIFGLNVGGEDDKSEIPKFTAQTKFDYPIAFPEPELIKLAFAQGDEIPRTIVIGRDGEVVTQIVGFSERIKAELDAAVEKAVNSAV